METPSKAATARWRCSTGSILLAGTVLRLALLLFGEWQDAHLQVKYTDIDYAVITDAAAAVAAGGSPFERATFRYTPLLAWVALPNIWLHPAACKLLFCAADILAGWLMDALLRREGAGQGPRAAAVAAWLFNPCTATISTRGSGEALVTCQLLGTLLALSTGHIALAGALFGLAVHWRIYPVVYALPALLSLRLPLLPQSLPAGWDRSSGAVSEQAAGSEGAGCGRELLQETHGDHGAGKTGPAAAIARQHGGNGSGSGSGRNGGSGNGSGRGATVSKLLGKLFSRERLAFSCTAAAVFLGLAALFHRLYGWQFIEEAYLYHGQRRDPRHNFSPLYYPTYLALGGSQAGSTGVGIVAAAAQLAAVAALGGRFAASLPVAWLLQTLAFVAFNKVVTAQYFVWYFSLAPLVLWQLQPGSQGRLAKAAAAWAAAAAHWLAWAYLLEFQGAHVHLAVWAAGLVFLAANVALLCVLVAACADAGGADQHAATVKLEQHPNAGEVPAPGVIKGNGH